MYLKYDNIVEKMISTVPELDQAYKNEVEWWDGEIPGPHIIFGDILNPLLINLLVSENVRNKEIIKRIFGFFEEMAMSDDENVQELLSVTVAERLGDNYSILNTAKKYMGPRTRIISDEIEIFWGRK